MVFPFIAAFIDRVTGYGASPVHTSILVSYSDIVNDFVTDSKTGWSISELADLRSAIANLKTQMVAAHKGTSPTGLFSLKFHLLDHLCDDLEMFKIVAFLDASPFESYNILIKKSYRRT